MPNRQFHRAVAITVVLWISAALSAQAAEPLTFERDVRPILKVYCLDCHGGGEKLEGNLDLRLVRFATKGGDSGPALVAKDVGASLLMKRMKAGEMPPTEKKVPAEQVAVIQKWIAAGAATLREEPEKLSPGVQITFEERSHWAFQPIRRPEPPQLVSVVTTEAAQKEQPAADLVRSPIDAFIIAKLREKNLKAGPEADKRTLLRRAAFDLTGLPPSQQDLDVFLADTSDTAYEKALDRLLESPHYGERWGRHWLDVAGYAESEGNGNDDTLRPYAYKYRDYVIRSLNADKPLDQFIIEQLAGDELVPQPWANLPPEQLEKLVATNFLRMAADPTATGGGNEAEGANTVVADTLKIVSSSLLGLTVGCAQCHDHKYDPIPQADYFRLRAVFEPALDPAHWRRPGQRLVSLYTDADRAKAAAVSAEVQKMQTEYNAKQTKYVNAALEKELLKFPEDQRAPLRDAYNAPADKRTPEQKQLLASNPKVNISPGVLYQYDEASDKELKADQAKIGAKAAERPVEDFFSMTNEIAGTLPQTKIFHRGDYRQPKQAVTPGDLTISAPDGQRLEIPEKVEGTPTSGRRLAYARHLVSGKHPQVGRVLANRIWLHHFGRGLVDTPGDLGILGTRPTHPELLDWLADELVQQKWSLKKLHKIIMLSSAYRRSSQSDTAASADLASAWYARFPVRRLEAETLRDCLLVASGTLDRTQFGPSIPVADDFVGQVIVDKEVPRRSVYLQVRRTKPVSFLTAFDAPVMTVNCERRSPSTGAPQSLMLMNSDFVLKQAGLVAQRARKETPAGFAADVTTPLAARYPRHSESWTFGYGAFDENTKRVAKFAPLPHFTGSAWQGGAALPDPALGWAILHAAGGHAGNDAEHAAIRRWTAPRGGFLAVSGKLKHGSENGNGVRGRLVSSRAGLIGEWIAKNGEHATEVARVEVQAGDTLDFAVDCQGDVNSDSFEWGVQLTLADAEGKTAGVWNSSADFHGPLGVPLAQQAAFAWQIAYQRLPAADELDVACQFLTSQIAQLKATGDKSDHELTALTNLCQQLLSSNEFLYVE